MFHIWSKSFLLVENKANIPVTPTVEDFEINGYTGTVTTLLEDSTYVTIYEFNPVLNITGRWFQGVYDSKPNKFLIVKENDEVRELINLLSLGTTAAGYTNTYFQTTGNIKQLKLYSNTVEKINITQFGTRVKPP